MLNKFQLLIHFSYQSHDCEQACSFEVYKIQNRSVSISDHEYMIERQSHKLDPLEERTSTNIFGYFTGRCKCDQTKLISKIQHTYNLNCEDLTENINNTKPTMWHLFATRSMTQYTAKMGSLGHGK